MQTLKTTLTALAALTLAAAAQTALAQATIKSIKADRTEAQLVDGRAAIKFTVEGDAPEDSNCGLIVDYSGIDTPDNRKINRKDGLLPKVVEHVFTRAGSYDVKAKGGKVTSSFGCFGQAEVKIVISEAPKPVGAAIKSVTIAEGAKAAAGCPEGWTLTQTTANKRIGAYACKPNKGVLKAPEKRPECPAGLVYFEHGATFGCEK